MQRMSSRKIKRSHSFDVEADQAIEEFGAGNRSAYVNTAVLEKAARDRALAFMAEYDEIAGVVPPDDRAAAQLARQQDLLILAERQYEAATNADADPASQPGGDRAA